MKHIIKQLYTTRMMYIIGKTRDHDGYDGFDKHAVTFPVYAWMLYLNYMVKGSSWGHTQEEIPNLKTAFSSSSLCIDHIYIA